MDFEKNSNYSSMNDSNYSNECLYNYFISYSTCPITDIIIENGKNDKYKNYTEIKINNNKYLYYTRNKKDGKLYKYTHDIIYEDDLTFLSDFDFNAACKIKIMDQDRSNNLFTNFKNIIDYGDIIIIIVIFYYAFDIYREPLGNRVFSFRKISNMIYELGILIFYLIRYSEFAEFKNFLFTKEDIYKDKGIYDKEENYYFPNKVFNLDSFPVAISLNMLLIRLIYIIIPLESHVHFGNKNENLDEENFIACSLGFFLFIVFLQKESLKF